MININNITNANFVYAANDDMHGYWKNVSTDTLYSSSCFSFETYSFYFQRHITFETIPDTFCFFKKSDAEACLTSFLNNRYINYIESKIDPVKFELTTDTQYAPSCEINTTDGKALALLKFNNFMDAPQKSSIKNFNSPSAWLVAVWNDYEDKNDYVALIDVYATIE